MRLMKERLNIFSFRTMRKDGSSRPFLMKISCNGAMLLAATLSINPQSASLPAPLIKEPNATPAVAKKIEHTAQRMIKGGRHGGRPYSKSINLSWL
jgi:hypothetical protein